MDRIMCAPPSSATIGQVSVKIVDANDFRTGLFIRNMSNNKIFLGLDHEAELDKGITLLPDESFSMSANDTSVADIYAIATGDNSLLCIQEFSCRRIE